MNTVGIDKRRTQTFKQPIVKDVGKQWERGQKEYASLMDEYKETRIKLHRLKKSMENADVKLSNVLGAELFNTDNGEYEKLHEFYDGLLEIQSDIRPAEHKKLNDYIDFVTKFLSGPAQTGDILDMSITTHVCRNLIEEILSPHRNQKRDGGKIKKTAKKRKQKRKKTKKRKKKRKKTKKK
jgi:hypothetical protein|tara:strand:- start:514 stop:1056 length:543 start_codon:yes stop_codon:yes gene_type:complete